MPVLEEEYKQYEAFVHDQAKQLKVFEFDNDQLLWHYTTGHGLLGIIESGTLLSTQVSCLNDSSEVRYGSNLLRKAYLDLLRQSATENPKLEEFLRKYELATTEDPSAPLHAPSYWFVTCFSRNGDDLSQWRAYCGGENGYAIAFKASRLFGNGVLVRVNYDHAYHQKAAEEIAKATFQFYQEGIQRRSPDAAQQWAAEFFPEFSRIIDQLAPMVKQPAFSSEEEYRIIHLLHKGELPRLQFRQKTTLMARHLPLTFTGHPLLPITQVRVGPSRHKEITRISVDTLLRQKGYDAGLVTASAVPFQLT
jgi:hypothetical protein